MKKVVIVVVVYKNIMDDYERISFESLIRVYKSKYDIYIVGPESMNAEAYLDYGVKEIRLPDIWFSSYRKYSELCLQPFFYTSFSMYEYMLLFQLDGFAFYDELEFFCELGYDYIGAPWEYGNFWYRNQNETIWYVGCGGVSLRNINAFVKLTECEDVLEQATYEQEDMVIVASYDKIKIAPVEVAKRFCITEYYDPPGEKMPMFLHWINHMNDEVYRNAIKAAGYYLPETVPYVVEWDKTITKQYTKYWLAEYEVKDVKEAVDNLMGRNMDRCYIWGTGNNAVIITKMFRELGIEIVAYIDNDEKKRDKLFMKKEVWDFSRISTKNIPVFVSPSKADSIAIQLNNKQYVKNKDYILWRDFVIESGIYKGGLK